MNPSHSGIQGFGLLVVDRLEEGLCIADLSAVLGFTQSQAFHVAAVDLKRFGMLPLFLKDMGQPKSFENDQKAKWNSPHAGPKHQMFLVQYV